MKTVITLAELKQLHENTENIIVIDVRSTNEYNEKHIPFAGNLPIDILETGSFTPEQGKIVVTTCGNGGGRSEQAANYLREHNKNEVYFLEGGTFGWFND